MADILYRPKGNGTTPPNNPCDDCHFRIHNPLNPLDHGVVPSDAFGKGFGFNETTGLPEAYERLPIASDTVLGGIKVGDRLTIGVDGTLDADVQGSTVTVDMFEIHNLLL